MSSENKVSISKIIPLIKIIRCYITKIDSEIPNEMRSMLFSIITGINLRPSNSEETLLLSQSTLLDKRFNKRGFESDNDVQERS